MVNGLLAIQHTHTHTYVCLCLSSNISVSINLKGRGGGAHLSQLHVTFTRSIVNGFTCSDPLGKRAPCAKAQSAPKHRILDKKILETEPPNPSKPQFTDHAFFLYHFYIEVTLDLPFLSQYTERTKFNMTSWYRTITSPFRKACTFFNHQQHRDKKSPQGTYTC